MFDGIAQVTKYNEKEAQNLIRDLVTAIHYLHSLKIVHRDIKPENLLLTTHDLNFIGSDKAGVRVKLADFGLAYEMKDDEPKLYTVCGTMFYISPEQLLANHGYDLKVGIDPIDRLIQFDPKRFLTELLLPNRSTCGVLA